LNRARDGVPVGAGVGTQDLLQRLHGYAGLSSERQLVIGIERILGGIAAAQAGPVIGDAAITRYRPRVVRVLVCTTPAHDLTHELEAPVGLRTVTAPEEGAQPGALGVVGKRR